MAGNAVIGQSGGPTAVINQSLVGAIEALTTAQKAGKIGIILGAKHGVRGIVNNEFLPLDNLSHDLLERVAQTPSSALGSTRDKPDEAYCQKIFESFKKNNVEHFFHIGGNDQVMEGRGQSAKLRVRGDTFGCLQRSFPTEWMLKGNDLSAEFIKYAKPLIGPLPKPGKIF